MAPDPRAAPRLAVFCALDAAGAAVADALSRYPAAPGVTVRCYRRAADRARGPEWESCDAAASPLGVSGDTGLEAVLRHALRATETADGLPETELVLVRSTPPGGTGPAIDPTLASAVAALRKRFSLLSMVTLVVLGRFESATRTGTGRLVWLPEEGEAGVDRVLLLDDVNVRGVPLDRPDADQATARTAEVLAEGTFGELARELLRTESGNRGHLGMGGRFLSLGFSRWALRGEASRRALAESLAVRMEAVMAALSTPSGPEADPPAPSPPPEPEADPPRSAAEHWLAPAVHALWKEGAQEAAGAVRRDRWLRGLEAAQRARLDEHFRRAGWNLRALVEEADARSGVLKQLPNLAALELSRFMQTFAPWYARWATGGMDPPAMPAPRVFRELNRGRVIAFLIALAAAILAGFGIYFARGGLEQGAALGLLLASAAVAVYVAVLGFYDVRSEEVRPPPPPPDLHPALYRHRDANWVANQLFLRSTADAEALRATLRELSGAAGVPLPQGVHGALHEVLLGLHGLDPAAEVMQFWDEQEAPAALAAAGAADIRAALRSYAWTRCAKFEELDWSQLASGLMAQAEAHEHALLDRLLRAIRDEAAPWMVVEGARSGVLVGIPHNLTPESREYIQDRLGRPTVVNLADTSRLAVLRYTQGYVTHAKDEGADVPWN